MRLVPLPPAPDLAEEPARVLGPLARGGKVAGELRCVSNAAVPRCTMERHVAVLSRFKALVAWLSTHLVGVSPAEFDRAIDEALEEVARCLDLDRIALYQVCEDRSRLQRTHSHAARPHEAPPRSGANAELPWLCEAVLQGRMVRIGNRAELPEPAVAERKYVTEQGIKSFVVIPIRVGRTPVGGLSYADMKTERAWPDGLIEELGIVSQLVGNALYTRRAQEKLEQALGDKQKLTERLEAENLYLQDETSPHGRYNEITGQSRAIRQVLRQVEQVAATNSSVLLLGDTGTGKQLVARAIHRMSKRGQRALITVDCASLPSALIESELFGHEKGAYTGAVSRQAGKFEIADGSTILLDEVGELPLEAQAKLLRVLQEGEFERLGSTRTQTTDVRVIAATNRDLVAAVEAGRFRDDLFYRLHVFPITVPPLRDRREDIPLLVWKFLEEFAAAQGRSIDTIPRATMAALESHPWPGNVRELRHVIERAVILSPGRTLILDELFLAGPRSRPGAQRLDTLESVERSHVLGVLESCGWKVKGPGNAAARLGLNPSTLRARMKKLGIERPSRRAPSSPALNPAL